jgi:hypothetical protein
MLFVSLAQNNAHTKIVVVDAEASGSLHCSTKNDFSYEKNVPVLISRKVPQIFLSFSRWGMQGAVTRICTQPER